MQHVVEGAAGEHVRIGMMEGEAIGLHEQIRDVSHRLPNGPP